jgi:hypothetical protein
MPSLDTIRTVTIRGQADNVDQTRAALDRLTASIQAANQNLSQTGKIANDNREGWRITGEGAANAANHLRQAAEAAYVFSPAFRSVVNEMAVPALKAAGTALEAVAAGIVTATNVAGAGVVRLGTAIETTFPAFALLATNVKAAGSWMEAFSPTLAGVATSILSKLLPALSLLGKGLLIYDAIKLVTQAWELGNAKLAEYVALSEKAASSGVSTEFYQRIAKAAEDAKLPVDALTEAFKKLNEAAAPRLGGTAATNRLKELVDAGNFGGNSGVGQLQNANGNEERLRAIASLVDQAFEKGQRLAALDITRSFLGDKVADNLAKDADYLDDMLAKADAIKAQDLVSAGTVANAVELQNRLDAAEKILSQRWHPIQDLLTQLGIKMKETWVDIVEAIAKAVDAVFKFGERIAEALSPMFTFLKMAADLAAKVASFAGGAVPGPLGAALSAAGGIGSTLLKDNGQNAADTQREALLADARKRLAEGLNRRFDTSKAPTQDNTSAFERAEESLRRYTETSKAAAASIDMTVDAQERLKAIAQLTAAGMKDGLTREAAAAKAEMSGLALQAGAAALALEKARVASEIRFGANTALLSQEDVQIATRLKGLYPDVATALGSVEAQAMRANNAFKQTGSAIESNLTTGLADIVDGTKSVSQGFADMSRQVLRAIEEMIIKIGIVTPLMQALQSAASSAGLLGGLIGIPSLTSTGAIAGAVGPTSVGGAPLVGLHGGGIVGLEATFMRSVNPANFNGAPRFHGGGIAGDEVPIIAKRGEGVFTEGQMKAMGGGGGPQTIQVHMSIDLTGANGDDTIARVSAAAAKAAFAQAVQVTNDTAPARQRKYQMLGS